MCAGPSPSRSIDRSLHGGQRRAPSFCIIGAQKSGTTSVYEHLHEHPLVLRGVRRESHAFDWRWDEGIPDQQPPPTSRGSSSSSSGGGGSTGGDSLAVTAEALRAAEAAADAAAARAAAASAEASAHGGGGSANGGSGSGGSGKKGAVTARRRYESCVGRFFDLKKLYEHPSCMCGDSTPSYLLHSDIVLPRM